MFYRILKLFCKDSRGHKSEKVCGDLACKKKHCKHDNVCVSVLLQNNRCINIGRKV